VGAGQDRRRLRRGDLAGPPERQGRPGPPEFGPRLTFTGSSGGGEPGLGPGRLEQLDRVARRVFRKAGCPRRADLIRLALQVGLV